MEHSVALLRVYLYSVKFTSDLCWLDCDLWTVSDVTHFHHRELKIEICDNPSVMASWFVSLSLLSEEVWSPFIAFLTHLDFCSEISVQKSKNLQFFSWVFSVSFKVHVGFLTKYLTSAIYSIHLRHFWCAWVSITFGDSSRARKTGNAQDSRHWYALFVQGQWMRRSTICPQEIDLLLTKIHLWELQLNQFNTSILNFVWSLLLRSHMCALTPAAVCQFEFSVTHKQCIFPKLVLSYSENILKLLSLNRYSLLALHLFTPLIFFPPKIIMRRKWHVNLIQQSVVLCLK